MLDGGYTKWASEGRATSTESVKPTTVLYNEPSNKAIFVQKDYVEEKLGKSVLVDTREADSYFGIERDLSTKRPGHIPTSKLLPAPWFWTTLKSESEEKTILIWKDMETIREIAGTVLGEFQDDEIIIYCGVGGYASPVYFLLTEVMGYRNVKFNDGSMQEWTADPGAPVAKYKYE
jgi:thiosulfate/3-mercaptopyruvate sulfurtransferase